MFVTAKVNCGLFLILLRLLQQQGFNWNHLVQHGSNERKAYRRLLRAMKGPRAAEFRHYGQDIVENVTSTLLPSRVGTKLWNAAGGQLGGSGCPITVRYRTLGCL
jgi:hypothetical protein